MPIKNKLSRREFLATGARCAAGLGVRFLMPTAITNKALGASGTALPASESPSAPSDAAARM